MASRLKSRININIGQFASTKPLSPYFGFDRGLPVDRYYIEDFLARNQSDIQGTVLEVGDAAYSRQYGGERIKVQDVLHVSADNPEATIVGDMSQEGVLPEGHFDCLVLTQTLHLIYDMPAAVRQMRRALRPGGVALVTVPGITPVDTGEWGHCWYWSLTPAAARKMFEEAFGEANVTVSAYGNVYAATSFLHGAALSEVRKEKLLPYDPAYPVVVCVRAVAT
ncbi:class I SAM-dependent methyltransferase [Novosphingobium mangrovi (ex Huang et al. 2023)]|uniref:Class I SAM-dependent methyltransferase n=1 Tax=Novosphingobium mangrovi (ex Huang et al. 2023) TaxID=2976432 RepID=A0ABT2I9R1_9SPHN|nr:class I SAM-dependent methyltransferase [Novosphingobium mangrovi (ex Huang et al. 2023)]MCT2401509.1 class I SAM-dependent methyltransferase [Novosphingobium mangrovi (ex Huang et al. 2023)]